MLSSIQFVYLQQAELPYFVLFPTLLSVNTVQAECFQNWANFPTPNGHWSWPMEKLQTYLCLLSDLPPSSWRLQLNLHNFCDEQMSLECLRANLGQGEAHGRSQELGGGAFYL